MRLISFTLKPEGNKNVEERHFAYGLQHRGGRNQKTQCHSYITIYNDIETYIAVDMLPWWRNLSKHRRINQIERAQATQSNQLASDLQISSQPHQVAGRSCAVTPPHTAPLGTQANTVEARLPSTDVTFSIGLEWSIPGNEIVWIEPFTAHRDATQQDAVAQVA